MANSSAQSKSLIMRENQTVTAVMPLGTLEAFDYQPRVRLIFGAGCSERAGELALEYGAKRVLLVTDSGIVAAGHAGPDDVVWAPLGLWGALVIGRDGHPFRARERRRAEAGDCHQTCREQGLGFELHDLLL